MPRQHPDFPNLVLFDHPLIQHKLSYIRDESVTHRPFRALLYQIAGLMVYEATRDFPTSEVQVRTPMETTPCRRLAGTITVVPILRSGLGMAEGILEMMPEARVGHLGLARDERPFRPHLTLGRTRRDAPPQMIERLGDTIRALPQLTPAAWVCERIVLFRSELRREGPHYTALAECSLLPAQTR